MSRIKYGLISLALLFVVSCQPSPESYQHFISAGVPKYPSGDTDTVFQFIGAGGFYLEHAGVAVMVDPFYSNPSLWSLISLQYLEPKRELIQSNLPPLQKVSGILVGHGHYDHAMDIPEVLAHLEQPVKVLGSQAAEYMLAPAFKKSVRHTFVNAEPFADSKQWIFIAEKIRVLPIVSEHSPHAFGRTFVTGTPAEALVELPQDALDWLSGTTLSYLVEFLDDNGMSRYRVFIQTSSSNEPVGLPDVNLLEKIKPVDLAVLAVANFDSVNNYPEYVLNALVPKQIVFVHWERFLDEYVVGEARPLRGMDLEKLVKRTQQVTPDARIHVPQRGAYLIF